MSDKFQIKILSGEITEDNRKRIHSVKDPRNNSLAELKFQLPIAYDGPKGENGELVYTPEHFFIAAISGCFITTFSVVSSNSKFKYNSLTIEASGFVGTNTGEKMMEEIEQNIVLKIPSSEKERKARRILEITEGRCPLAKSIKSKVNNSYTIIVE